MWGLLPTLKTRTQLLLVQGYEPCWLEPPTRSLATRGIAKVRSSIPAIQKIACAFGGEEIPPGMLSGVDDTKKVHRWSFLHVSARRSRSNISPWGSS